MSLFKRAVWSFVTVGLAGWAYLGLIGSGTTVQALDGVTIHAVRVLQYSFANGATYAIIAAYGTSRLGDPQLSVNGQPLAVKKVEVIGRNTDKKCGFQSCGVFIPHQTVWTVKRTGAGGPTGGDTLEVRILNANGAEGAKAVPCLQRTPKLVTCSS